MAKVICQQCGKLFLSKPSQNRKYCSRENEDLTKAGFLLLRLKEKNLRQHGRHTETECSQNCVGSISSYISK